MRCRAGAEAITSSAVDQDMSENSNISEDVDCGTTIDKYVTEAEADDLRRIIEQQANEVVDF